MGYNNRLLVVCKKCCNDLKILFRPSYVEKGGDPAKCGNCGADKCTTNLTYEEVTVISNITNRWDYYEKLMALKENEPEVYADLYEQLVETGIFKYSDKEKFEERKAALGIGKDIMNIDLEKIRGSISSKTSTGYTTQTKNAGSTNSNSNRSGMESNEKGLVITGVVMIVLGLIVCAGAPALGILNIVLGGIVIIIGFVQAAQIENGTMPNEAQRRVIEANTIENERKAAINASSSDAPWERKYYTSPCPYCGHYKVRPAKWEDKRMSVAFWGGASDKIGKRYKCENCSKMWS